MRATEFAFPLELKFAASTGEITGYGSTFGNVDSYGDKVAPGAFRATLSEHKAAGTAPAMLWMHDPSAPIGVWQDASEDGKGLLLKGKLTLETQRGAEARSLAAAGALALSIGFLTKDAAYEKGGTRILKDVQLYEVSLVSMPANTQAKLTSIKSAGADDVRDAIGFERFLKSQGFPNSLARRLAAGWDNATGRQDDGEAKQLIAELKSSAARFLERN